jgi:hypothetical protein
LPAETRIGDTAVNANVGAIRELPLSHVSARAIEALCFLMLDICDLEMLI